MKQIYVQPQIKVRHFVAHNILASSGDPTVHTNVSATQGGTALSKQGGLFDASAPAADQEEE